MNRNTMDHDFAAAAREQLVRRAMTGDRAGSGSNGSQLRTTLVTGIVAVGLVAATVGVLHAVGVRTPPQVGSTVRASDCDHLNVAPFTCGEYLTTGGTDQGTDLAWLRTAPLKVRFERMNGAVVLVALGPVNTNNVPIVISPTGGTSSQSAVSDVGCVGGTSCDRDAWLTRFFNTRLTYSVTGDSVRIASATAIIYLRAAATVARPTPSDTALESSY